MKLPRSTWQQAAACFLLMLLGLIVSGCGGGGGSDAGPTPVTISTQPVSQSAVAGAGAGFSVTAGGTGLAYQWQRSVNGGAAWGDLAAATAASYTIAATDTSMNGQQFRVVVTGTANAVTSSAATLTVTPAVAAPAITSHPADLATTVGSAAMFSVTATGTAPAYQWQVSPDGSTWTPIAGATAASLTVPTLALADSGKRYRVIASNAAGTATSNGALLTVTAAAAAPQISTQPLPVNVVVPQAGSFSAAVTGTPTPSLQWQQSSNGGTSWADIAGATATSYATPATVLADNGKLLRVHVFNAVGDVYSTAVMLSVSAAAVAPAITTQPAHASVIAPAAASFTVSASGTPTPTYQWQTSSDAGASFSNINGATQAGYTTPATVPGDNGKQFRVVVGNNAASINSNAATMTVSAGALAGVAAVGRAIVGGTVQGVCAAGPALPATTTDSSGHWQLALVGQTLPCALRASRGSVGGAANSATFVSIATAAGTANLTPLTHLLVANLAGTATPDAWFAGLSSNASPLATITATQVNTSLSRLAATLTGLTPLASTNPVTTAFTAVAGNVSDDMLVALAQALASSGVAYATLVTAAATPSFAAPSAAFSAALLTAYASAANLALPTGSGGSNTAGLSGSSLVLQAGSGTLSATTFSNATSYLMDFAGMGTTATVPYSEATGLSFFGTLTADRNGGLWASRDTVPDISGYQVANAIVKFIPSASSPGSLVPAVMITLTPQLSVNHMAFDSAGNLWLDVIDLNTPNTGAARIVQYTAASGYATTGTVINYSGNGGWSGGCQGAGMAFDFSGHLHTLESYSNGLGQCINRVREYTAAGAVVSSKYYPAGYTGNNYGDLAVDAAGNLWVASAAVDCTSALLSSCRQPPYLYKVGPTGILLQSIPLPNVQEVGRMAIDANGNLWFGGNVTRMKYCSGTMTQHVYQLPAGAGTPAVAFSHVTACATPLTFYFGVAVNPRPANLP